MPRRPAHVRHKTVPRAPIVFDVHATTERVGDQTVPGASGWIRNEAVPRTPIGVGNEAVPMAPIGVGNEAVPRAAVKTIGNKTVSRTAVVRIRSQRFSRYAFRKETGSRGERDFWDETAPRAQ